MKSAVQAMASNKTGRVGPVIRILIVLSFVLLNLATLLTTSTTGTAEDSRGRLYTLWLAAPVLLWVMGARAVLRAPRTAYWAVTLLWGYLLVAHALLAAATLGYTVGVASFMAWGVWVGGFLWLTYGRLRPDWARMLLILFAVGGFLNALPVIYEWGSGAALLRYARVGEVVRRYGISQSISVLGVQLGAGILATLYLGMSARSTTGRLLTHLIGLVQWTGLVLAASRGPLLFSAAGLAVVAYAQRRNPSQFITQHTRLILGGALTGLFVVVILKPGTLTLATFVFQAFTSEDVGNQVRVERWMNGIRTASQDLGSLLFGLGAGSSVAIPNLRGLESVTHESSLVKLFNETGLVGLILMLRIVYLPVKRSLAVLRRPAPAHPAALQAYRLLPPVVGITLLLIMEVLIQDMIMAWVIALYFWLCLGTLWQLCRAATAEAPGGEAPADHAPRPPRWAPKRFQRPLPRPSGQA